METMLQIPGTNGLININLSGKAAGNLEDACGALVMPFMENKFVMTFHSKRKSWEFPAGRREAYETPEECAIRETLEETGAVLSSVKPIGYYTVDAASSSPRKTAVYVATVVEFVPKPAWSETDEVRLFAELPDNLSYENDTFVAILEHVHKAKVQ